MRGISRWIFVIHRYAGLALSLLMLMWCLSGIVMLYVPWPALSEQTRISGLRPLDWRQCCVFPASGRTTNASLEMMDGRLLLQGNPRPLDLSSGRPVTAITLDEARAVATDFARGNGLAAEALAPEQLDHDQWTVSNFRRDKPLYRVALNDSAGTVLYVSSRTGRVVQSTDRMQRFWNYLGAIPHWLYITELRANPKAWAETMIWTSLGGCFLVLTGLYAGIRQWLRARRANRWSPYHGFTWWHHLPGLVFGLFLFTWTFSGLLSMNPWGLLENRGDHGAAAALAGPPKTLAEIGNALGAISIARRGDSIRTLTLTPLNGRLYFLAIRDDGTKERWDGGGHDASLTRSDINWIAGKLSPGRPPELLQQNDDYYFGVDGEILPLPVWRMIAENGDRFYVDANSGRLIGALDGTARIYRWLFQGLHRLDFVAVLRLRPVWDVVTLGLLLGATFIAATGGWLALKFLMRPRRTGLR